MGMLKWKEPLTVARQLIVVIQRSPKPAALTKGFVKVETGVGKRRSVVVSVSHSHVGMSIPMFPDMFNHCVMILGNICNNYSKYFIVNTFFYAD